MALRIGLKIMWRTIGSLEEDQERWGEGENNGGEWQFVI